jgi:hypothetical protein
VRIRAVRTRSLTGRLSFANAGACRRGPALRGLAWRELCRRITLSSSFAITLTRGGSGCRWREQDPTQGPRHLRRVAPSHGRVNRTDVTFDTLTLLTLLTIYRLCVVALLSTITGRDNVNNVMVSTPGSSSDYLIGRRHRPISISAWHAARMASAITRPGRRTFRCMSRIWTSVGRSLVIQRGSVVVLRSVSGQAASP